MRSLHEEMRAAIEKHRAASYKSESNIDRIPTGNRYQAMALQQERVGGFRTAREELLSRILFDGATVLDVGCNTGELARTARRLGALLVDGFDYDPYWIAVGQLVNAYNGSTRVSLYTADATDPEAYGGTYDIVLAFSVFPYLVKALPAVIAATGRMLVLETHQLSRVGAEQQYLDALRPFLPVHRELGGTDWGAELDGRRLVYAFARDEATLDELVTSGSPALEAPSRPSAGLVDVEHSSFAYLAAFEREYRLSSAQELPALLARIDAIDLARFSATDRLNVASGVSYWIAFLKGYAEYLLTGRVTDEDIFVTYVAAVYREREFDAAFKPVVDDRSQLVERVLRRYQTLDALRAGQTGIVAPVTLINTNVQRAGFRILDAVTKQWLSCEQFDGYHTLFCARLCRVAELRFVCVPGPTAPSG